MTWGRDSHNLFDYESRNSHKKQLQTFTASGIVRDETDVQLISSDDFKRLRANTNLLATLVQENGNFYVTGEEEPLWLVVRSLKTNDRAGYVLKLDDVIKLGRASYLIKELNLGSEDAASDRTQESEEDSSEVAKDPDSGICRICFGEAESENPLITPCGCNGSVKHIHLVCIQKWLSYRKSIKQSENSAAYHWKTMECELCKSTYPFSLDIQGKDHNLFQVEKSNLPYIVLEGIGHGKGNAKGVHLITFSKDCAVKLGRGHESDVRISDISVSRCHAIIKYENNQFILEDNNSKFGTLLQVCEPIELVQNSTVALQSGRTVLALSMKPCSNYPFDASIEAEESLDPFNQSL